MPYVALPTLSDGQILSASFLNQLSANQAFIFGVANNANAPFNSYRGLHVNFDEQDMIWYVRHRVPWLHWRINGDATWLRARMWFNGVKVGEAPVGTSWSGNYNLASWAGVPNLLGAWASGVSYSDNVNGAQDDGHVVTQSGQYYRCTAPHTSAAGNQPGIGASWASFWSLLTLPGIGTICQVWLQVDFNTAHEVGVEYIIETDAASF